MLISMLNELFELMKKDIFNSYTYTSIEKIIGIKINDINY